MRLLLIAIAMAVIMLSLPALSNAVPLGSEFQNMETLFKKGNLDELASQVYSAKPQTDEERSLQTYLSAMLKTKRADSTTLLQQAIDRFPNTHYGQLSALERAKIHLLEREVTPAKALLMKINAPNILERYYWLAVCADIQDDSPTTISNIDTYLRLEPMGEYLEEAYFLLASAYEKQNKLQSAISTLNKLGSLTSHPRNAQYFHYQLGRLYFKAENPSESLQQFKTGFEINKNSQIAFQIEDEFFALKSKYGSKIDLSFLYPYPELDLPQITGECPVIEPPKPQIDATAPMRLAAKPSGGYFVQAGRFGVEANANKLSYEIRQKNVLASYFEDKSNKSTPWVVISGPYPSKSEAETARQTLINNSIDCFITRF